MYENEHGPASQPPLLRGGGGSGQKAGGEGPPDRIVVNGYSFIRTDSSGEMPWPSALPDLGGETALGRWRDHWLTQVEAHFQELLAFEPAAVAAGSWERTLKAQAAEYMRLFRGVHGESVVTSGRIAGDFVDAYAAHFGEERRPEALALLQGFDNRTLDRALALWALSRTVRADLALRDMLAGGELPAAGAFAGAFDAFLDEFGYTIDEGVADAPTWREDPARAIALVLRYAARPDGAGPGSSANTQRARRVELEAALREAAVGDDRAAELLRMLPAAQELLPVREDHNTLCDQRLGAASRSRWLRVGEHLVARGLVREPSDVFFHELSELYRVLDGDGDGDGAVQPETLAKRRAEQAAFRAAQPPAFLGQPPTGFPTGGVIAGTGASAGVYEGRARVIRSLAEAGRLADGEVLVCGVTAPTWTPYFALAGAVVTDAGGALSHTAVVAREYGIPAVTGTRTGTRDIPDGATIRVDGLRGTVSLLATA